MAKEYVSLSIQKKRSQNQPSNQQCIKVAVAAGTGLGNGEVIKRKQAGEQPNKQQSSNQNKSMNQKKVNPGSFSAVSPNAQDMKVKRHDVTIIIGNTHYSQWKHSFRYLQHYSEKML